MEKLPFGSPSRVKHLTFTPFDNFKVRNPAAIFSSFIFHIFFCFPIKKPSAKEGLSLSARAI
jgi:hypothetical protein